MLSFSPHSEFFNKGPRPRRKEQDQNNTTTAGVELVDTLPNHVVSADAPLAVPDTDSRSVASIDRSPHNSVGALACFRNAGNAGFSILACCRVPGRRASLNDDSPTYVGHRSVTHEMAYTKSSPLADKSLHAMYCETAVDGACCDIDTDRKFLYPEFPAKTSESLNSLQPANKMDALYSKSNIAYSVNPVPKPGRNETETDNSVKQQSHPNGLRSHNGEKEHHEGTMPNPPSYYDLKDTEPLKMNGKNIVYLNRQPSDDNLEQTTDRKDSFAHMLDTLLDKKLDVGGIHEHEDIETNETERLLADTRNVKVLEPVSIQVSDETGWVNENDKHKQLPLLKKQRQGNRKSRPPNLIHLKSHSLERAEKALNYDSDDSIGNAGSLASHSSTVSRLSKLSVATCPSVRIDPREARSIPSRDTRGLHPAYNARGTSSLPSRKVNIGFIAYSSVDTETSEALSSSCDSLSPRSDIAGSELTPNSPLLQSPDSGCQKSSRNVAIGSLKHRGCNKQLFKSDEDSGRESLPKDRNGSPRLFEQPSPKDNNGGLVGHPSPDNIVLEQSEIQHTDTPPRENGEDTNNANVNGFEKGKRNPYYSQDVTSKRTSLKKQAGSELEFSDD